MSNPFKVGDKVRLTEQGRKERGNRVGGDVLEVWHVTDYNVMVKGYGAPLGHCLVEKVEDAVEYVPGMRVRLSRQVGGGVSELVTTYEGMIAQVLHIQNNDSVAVRLMYWDDVFSLNVWVIEVIDQPVPEDGRMIEFWWSTGTVVKFVGSVKDDKLIGSEVGGRMQQYEGHVEDIKSGRVQWRYLHG